MSKKRKRKKRKRKKRRGDTVWFDERPPLVMFSAAQAALSRQATLYSLDSLCRGAISGGVDRAVLDAVPFFIDLSLSNLILQSASAYIANRALWAMEDAGLPRSELMELARDIGEDAHFNHIDPLYRAYIILANVTELKLETEGWPANVMLVGIPIMRPSKASWTTLAVLYGNTVDSVSIKLVIMQPESGDFILTPVYDNGWIDADDYDQDEGSLLGKEVLIINNPQFLVELHDFLLKYRETGREDAVETGRVWCPTNKPAPAPEPFYGVVLKSNYGQHRSNGGTGRTVSHRYTRIGHEMCFIRRGPLPIPAEKDAHYKTNGFTVYTHQDPTPEDAHRIEIRGKPQKGNDEWLVIKTHFIPETVCGDPSLPFIPSSRTT
jgi:hypothetical protein